MAWGGAARRGSRIGPEGTAGALAGTLRRPGGGGPAERTRERWLVSASPTVASASSARAATAATPTPDVRDLCADPASPPWLPSCGSAGTCSSSSSSPSWKMSRWGRTTSDVDETCVAGHPVVRDGARRRRLLSRFALEPAADRFALLLASRHRGRAAARSWPRAACRPRGPRSPAPCLSPSRRRETRRSSSGRLRRNEESETGLCARRLRCEYRRMPRGECGA
jgi:hypothetical protein